MHLHFYATITAINGIQEGHEMLVYSKENKPSEAIHVSFDIKEYRITKSEDSRSLYNVQKRK